MHNKHIFAVKANNAEIAISRVENELESAEHLTCNNWWHILGAVDLVSGAYTFNDTDRDYDKLHSIEGIKELFGKYTSKEKYERLIDELENHTSKEEWFEVERCAKELDGIKNAVKGEFVLNADTITEVNADDWFEFGISDWVNVLPNEEDDVGVYAVIVDFHS